jgi:hypothetical protein
MPASPVSGGKILSSKPLLGTDESSAGVTGQSNVGPGVLGQSLGTSACDVPGGATSPNLPATDGVLGEGNNGVRGVSGADYGSGPAPTGAGIWGANSASGPGVYGTSATGDGVLGNAYHGVHGQSSKACGSGVWGENAGSGAGVSGTSASSYGVQGTPTTSVRLRAEQWLWSGRPVRWQREDKRRYQLGE